MEMEENIRANHPDEIDLAEVIGFLWSKRKTILIITGIFTLLGLFVALTATPMYKAEARILPEIQQQRTGTSALLRQFGGMAGLPVGMESYEALRPDLYPAIVSATPFFYELLSQEIRVSFLDHPVTVQTYLEEHMQGSKALGALRKYTLGLPGTIMGWIKGKPGEEEPRLAGASKIPRLSRKEYDAIRILRGAVESDMDLKAWIISVSAEFPDPMAAAYIANFAVEYLSDYIIEYRIQKAEIDLTFVKERYEEKKAEFYSAQLKLARFRDANKNIVSATVQTEEQRLMDEYNLAFAIYNQLAQKLEETRLRVQEETPVIKLLEPVKVPVKRSKPNRKLILAVFVLLGVVGGVVYVYGVNYLSGMAARMQNT